MVVVVIPAGACLDGRVVFVHEFVDVVVFLEVVFIVVADRDYNLAFIVDRRRRHWSRL